MALMVTLAPQTGNVPDIANLLQRINTGFNQINDTFSGAATARGETVGPFVLDNVTINPTNPGAGKFTTISASGQITSTVTTGTAPLVVSSTTVVSNLNAALLNGATFAAPGPLGSTTASTGTFTTLAASSTVSGAGFTARFSTPGPIGNAATSTGAFSSVVLDAQIAAKGLATNTAASAMVAYSAAAFFISSGPDASNYAPLNLYLQHSDGSAGVTAIQVSYLSSKTNATWANPPLSSAGLVAGTLYQGAANAAFFA